ncbi:MAG: adenylosuccinate lyase [Spirochaetes bacterium]|nr:adenylosuccinate lyase [Spirochaetota bacterium]
MHDFSSYLSPYSWRYGSLAMRELWSERSRRLLWRRIWCALARVQSGFGLVTPAQVAELESRADDIDIERSLEIEAELRHDLMAEVRAFAERCPTAGGIIHLGATSMDIEDNADAVRMGSALDIVAEKLAALLGLFAERIDAWADTPVMAFTHLQPAEPTTLGYRFASWAQDVLGDYRAILRTRAELRGKGFKGAVGTAASYVELLGEARVEAFERAMSEALGIRFFPIATQTYPRRQDYEVVSVLAGIGASLHKFAFDLRVLQSPPIGELSEPFGSKQVGSSAMPFKRNPINAEKIDSLARALSVLPQVAWQNAAQSLLERTLDDSANRRSMLPEAFLACDEILETARKLAEGMVVDGEAIRRTLDAYSPFAATERIMMAAAKAGADRQDCHERLREHALAAWTEVRAGRPNPLSKRIVDDPFFIGYLGAGTVLRLMGDGAYAGTAPARARAMAVEIRQAIAGQEIAPHGPELPLKNGKGA